MAERKLGEVKHKTMLGSGLRYQSYVGRAKGFFRAQYFQGPVQHSFAGEDISHALSLLVLVSKPFCSQPPPPPPSSLGGSSQGCRGYLHVRLRLFQFTQAPSPHPSIGDGLNRNVKYGSPCQFGSLGIFNQQLISIFTLGLSGWSIQKRRTRLRWKMSSCLVCRFLTF